MEFKNRTIRMTELINTIQQANVMNTPWSLPDNSIDCCVTSPPYWGLRDYGVNGQLGLEKTPEEYVTNMVSVFEEVRRVLKPEGTLWLNLGDCYNSNPRGKSSVGINKGRGLPEYNTGKREPGTGKTKIASLKPKDLVGIPWMVAFALRSAGWYLRQDVIWHKPNPMPESVTDRCTKAHEYIFMLTKSAKYYYDYEAIKTPGLNPADDIRRIQKATLSGKSTPGLNNGIRQDKQRGHSRRHNGFNERWDKMSTNEQMSMGANKRSVWTVSTAMYSEAHFATFPEALITPCILAGCPKDGIVLDHFMGAGTTAVVAKSHGRNYIGYELNPEYIEIANKRLKKHFGMFA